jgi:hypothetical protein
MISEGSNGHASVHGSLSSAPWYSELHACQRLARRSLSQPQLLLHPLPRCVQLPHVSRQAYISTLQDRANRAQSATTAQKAFPKNIHAHAANFRTSSTRTFASTAPRIPSVPIWGWPRRSTVRRDASIPAASPRAEIATTTRTTCPWAQGLASREPSRATWTPTSKFPTPPTEPRNSSANLSRPAIPRAWVKSLQSRATREFFPPFLLFARPPKKSTLPCSRKLCENRGCVLWSSFFFHPLGVVW